MIKYITKPKNIILPWRQKLSSWPGKIHHHKTQNFNSQERSWWQLCLEMQKACCSWTSYYMVRQSTRILWNIGQTQTIHQNKSEYLHKGVILMHHMTTSHIVNLIKELLHLNDWNVFTTSIFQSSDWAYDTCCKDAGEAPVT